MVPRVLWHREYSTICKIIINLKFTSAKLEWLLFFTRFLSSEIISHNGEEEYTEKVDCFSFGMFLYELITLRQPFEGHETVKESILEGSRPVFTTREVMFPSYCLDLMVLCWDQQPKVTHHLLLLSYHLLMIPDYNFYRYFRIDHQPAKLFR